MGQAVVYLLGAVGIVLLQDALLRRAHISLKRRVERSRNATPPPPLDTVGAAPACARLACTVRNLHKAYGSHNVLNWIELSIREGEILVLVGPNGCGIVLKQR